MRPTVAVLFARSDSVYRRLPGCEVFDEARDARTFFGGMPIVAHPPCRAWGRLRTFAKPRHDERDLARFAVSRVRACGGVLEHPASSALWPDQGLPLGKSRDAWGGFTLSLDQCWFGHEARKATWLYIVGVQAAAIPALPYSLDAVHRVIGSSALPEISKADRERTPERLAVWLVELARSCRVSP